MPGIPPAIDDTIFGMHRKIYRHLHSRDVQQCSRLTMPVLIVTNKHIASVLLKYTHGAKDRKGAEKSCGILYVP